MWSPPHLFGLHLHKEQGYFTLGFKMFRKECARDIFSHQYDNNVVAEAEIVFVSKLRNHKIKELPIKWTNSKDSRIRPFRETYRSLKGLSKMILNNLKGKYKR